MKKIALMVATAALAGGAYSETWYWTGSSSGQWTGNNWTNATDATQLSTPSEGDTAILGVGNCASAVLNVCNNNRAMYEIRFTGNKRVDGNQGNYRLQAGGRGLQYLFTSSSGSHWCGLTLDGNGEVPVNILADFVLQKGALTANGSPVLVKQGAGKLIMFNQSGFRDYTIPLTLIQQGAIDLTVQRTQSNIVLAFDGDDTSQRISFCYATYSSDLTINNGGILETNGVNNTAHGITSPRDYQLALTGTPKYNPMVFSGQFYSKAGLRWSPSSSDCVFVCSNAVSATTGSLIVEKGTVKLVTGASFTALSRLNVAAGAVFQVDAGAGTDFHADALTLGDATAKVVVGENVSLEMGAAVLNGAALSPGTYTADGANGTRTAAWIEGEGQVAVLTGPANSGTWSGGGTDTLATTDDNWAGGTAPDLTAGDLLATFATGGTAAALPAGLAAAFDGIVLNNTSGGPSFAFTAGSGASATVGASGLSAIAAATATAWSFGWPMTLTEAQTWTVAAGNTLKIEAPWGGSQALTLDNAGRVEFNAPSTHSGALTLPNGTYRAAADNALGTAARTVEFHHDVAKLYFGGTCTLDSPIHSGKRVATAGPASSLLLEDGADVTFNGLVAVNSNWAMTVPAGSRATFRKGCATYTDGMEGFIYLRGGGTIVVTNASMSAGQCFFVLSNNPVTLDLWSTGNISGTVTYWSEIHAGRINAHVANAFNTGVLLYMTDSTLDLGGYDQNVRLFQGTATSTVTSERPAQLCVACSVERAGQTSTGGDSNRVCMASFTGCAGLTKLGSYPFALGAVSSTTGRLEVASGILTMNAAAVWPNCTNVVVSGGTFAVKNANAFGAPAQGERPKLELDVAASGATLDLDYTGRIDCKELRVAGVKRYGTFGATGSGAENEVAWITGTGTVRALPSGTVISLR